MHWDTDRRASSAVIVVKAFLFLVSSVFAALTVLTHVVQATGVSFRVFAFLCIGLSFIVLAAGLAKSWGILKDRGRKDGNVLVVVLILGSVGAVLALVSHRTDTDDFYYVPNAVYYLENVDQPMGFGIHFLDSANQAFVSHTWGTSLAYDYVRGVIAYFLRFDFLDVYYILSVAFVGFLIPLALFFLTSHFSNDAMSAAIGTAVTVGVLLFLGDTHRTFGNFAFNRAYQGKVLMLAVGVPLFTAASIDFFKRRSVLSWLLLFATSVAMVGATASTIVLLPALALVLLIAYFVVARDKQRAVATSLTYLASFGYLVAYALVVDRSSTLDLGIGSPININFPTTYSGHIEYLVNTQKPVTPVVLVVTTVLSIILTSGIQRRFLLAWMMACIVLYLNPLVAPWIIEYVTTPNMYWRMFYIYPFPLVVSITASLISEIAASFPKDLRISMAVLVGVAFIGLHFTSFSASVFQHRTEIAWPGYKLSNELIEDARAIIAVTPKGAMLAPAHLCGVVPMLSSGYPQSRVRQDGIRLWLGSQGLPDEAEIRIEASEFVGGKSADLNAFRTFLQQNNVRSIVIRDDVFESLEVKDLLRQHHYTNEWVIDGYVVVWN